MLNFWPILRVHMLIGFMLIKKTCIDIKNVKNVELNAKIVSAECYLKYKNVNYILLFIQVFML